MSRVAVSGDLRRLRAAVAAFRQVLFDLLGARAGCVQVLLRVAFDLWCSAFSRLDLVTQVAELVGKRRLVHRGRIVLGIEQALRLKRACRSVFALGHIHDEDMRVELGSGVAIDRAGGVMLELCGNEFAGRLGWIVPPDSGLSVAFQLCESGGDGGAMRLTHPLITPDQGRKRDRLWS